jgi:hypothetical protein
MFKDLQAQNEFSVRIPRVDDRISMTVQVSGDYQSPIKRDDGSEIQWYTTDTMVTQYGREVSITKFDRTVAIYKGRRKRSYVYNNKNKKLQKNLKRAQLKIKRLAMQNYPLKKEKYNSPCFLTLTYKDPECAHPKNRATHLRDVQEFFRMLRAEYGKQIKYIQVFEIQPERKENRKETCVHVHALLFNLPYNDMQKVFGFWKHGDPNAQHMRRLKTGYSASRQNCEKIAGYITKFARYVSKDLADSTAYYEKTYLPSKGLEKPISYTTPDMVRAVLSQMELELYTPLYRSKPVYCPHFGAWSHQEVWVPN